VLFLAYDVAHFDVDEAGVCAGGLCGVGGLLPLISAKCGEAIVHLLSLLRREAPDFLIEIL
jgi:hypothetical protein